tara:strand:+ start:165 stop:572 length:408 start_codon:yes stop_codon:yes gene_type:complete
MMADVNRVSRSFKDISLSFLPHPVTGDLGVLRDARAIRQSVRNIVETIPGEKFFEPLFGSDVRGQLFENANYATAFAIEDQITVSLENFEPRIDDIVVKVDLFTDQNEVGVSVAYNIVGEEFPPQNYTFILTSTR